MRVFDFLFGPRYKHVDYGTLVMRSLVLDPDDVRELLSLVKERTGHGELEVMPIHRPRGERVEPTKYLAPGEIEGAADWERNRLRISTTGKPDVGVRLELGRRPSVSYTPHDEQAKAFAEEIAELLLASGSPRLHWKPWLRSAPVLTWLCVVAALVAFAAGERPNWLLLVVLGGLVLASVVPVASGVQWIAARVGPGFPGHRIRSLSRQEVRARRADRNANLRVSAVTIPTGAFIGALAGWLFTR